MCHIIRYGIFDSFYWDRMYHKYFYGTFVDPENASMVHKSVYEPLSIRLSRISPLRYFQNASEGLK
jgi:hypothetical protein